MGAGAELDFTELLDDLIAASNAREAEEADTSGTAPSLQVDLLDQIERLQSENIQLFPDRAAHAYGEHASAHRAEADAAAARLQPALDDLFFLDPETISRELGIKAQSRPDELDRARRTFAMRYHPDRVPEEFRDRAALRMQIANMLIDQAKGRRR